MSKSISLLGGDIMLAIVILQNDVVFDKKISLYAADYLLMHKILYILGATCSNQSIRSYSQWHISNGVGN
jgi:hypothetical protein